MLSAPGAADEAAPTWGLSMIPGGGIFWRCWLANMGHEYGACHGQWKKPVPDGDHLLRHKAEVKLRRLLVSPRIQLLSQFNTLPEGEVFGGYCVPNWSPWRTGILYSNRWKRTSGVAGVLVRCRVLSCSRSPGMHLLHC